jgi:hypothetical protein
MGVLLLSGCVLQPNSRPGHRPPLFGGVRWDPEMAQGGMIGVVADEKGSKGTWSFDDGPKPPQRALRVDYDLAAGGFVRVRRTIERLNLVHATGLRFMARADPPCTVQLSMTDANEISYVAVFQIPSTSWSEIDAPMAALDEDPNQDAEAKVGHRADWKRATSMSFDARTEGQGKFWIGTVYVDD